MDTTLERYPKAMRGLPNPLLEHPEAQTVEIPLTRGKSAVIDARDFATVQGFLWRARCDRGRWYAIARRCSLKDKGIFMHRLILAVPKGKVVDHRSGNGLDNRRENIRACTDAENAKNQRKKKNNTTGFKGVHLDKQRGKFVAQITFGGKTHHIAQFTDLILAAEAYDKAALNHFGEFAQLNFPRERYS